MDRITKPFSDEELLHYKFYSEAEIEDAVLILNAWPQTMHLYNITRDKSYKELSNFHTLETPIFDEYWNEFRDSEWYYMAGRAEDKKIKKIISLMSGYHGLARNSRKYFQQYLSQDEVLRANVMREAIYKKFDNNPYLQDILRTTFGKAIIEYTYWEDTLFGIEQKQRLWRNVLWKLITEYRDLKLV